MMEPSRVFVFGASGRLGSSLVPQLRAMDFQVFTQGRNPKNDLCLNPFSRVAIVKALNEYRPSALVNLIAETNVDLCEKDPQLAHRVNGGVVRSLFESTEMFHQQTGSRPHLVQLSTDQLYNGVGPHTENDVDPVNVYGVTKYIGELFAQQGSATILRTNFFGRSQSTGRPSFSDWLFAKLSHSDAFTVFDDVRFSPLHIDTLCRIIAQCIIQKPTGVFNAGSRDALSKAGFAEAFSKILNLPFDRATIGSVEDVALRARRPKDMSLKVSRLENTIGIQCPTINDEIIRVAREY